MYVEYIDQPDLTAEFNGRLVVPRRFRIHTGSLTREQVILNPASIVHPVNGPLPSYGSRHPRLPGAQLVSYSVSQTGTVLDAIAFYSTAREGEGLGSSFQTEEFAYPVGIRLEQYTQTGGVVAVGSTWAVVDQTDRMSVFRRRRSVYFHEQASFGSPPGGGLGAFNLVLRSQLNKVHRFQNEDTLYRFEGGDVQFVARRFVTDGNTSTVQDWYFAAYNWIGESGIPYKESPAPNRILYPGPFVLRDDGTIGTGGPDDMLLPPFCKIDFNLRIEPGAAHQPPPEFVCSINLKINLEGWRTLPGL